MQFSGVKFKIIEQLFYLTHKQLFNLDFQITQLVEIFKSKSQPIKTYDPYTPKSVTLWTSTGEEAKDIFKYLCLHGVPYHVWEKGEPEYAFDIGFASEEDKNFYVSVFSLSQDGGYIFKNESPYKSSYESWLKNKLSDKTKKGKLPLHMKAQWISKDDQQWYEGEIVLPQDFRKTFTHFISSNDKTNIFLVMDKQDISLDYAMGTLWLSGNKNKEEIMKFRLSKLNVVSREFYVSKYSLPKNYVIPEWKGRVAIEKPSNFEYYQKQ